MREFSGPGCTLTGPELKEWSEEMERLKDRVAQLQAENAQLRSTIQAFDTESSPENRGAILDVAREKLELQNRFAQVDECLAYLEKRSEAMVKTVGVSPCEARRIIMSFLLGKHDVGGLEVASLRVGEYGTP